MSVKLQLITREGHRLYARRRSATKSSVFPDFKIETFPERHHFDPPYRIEPERLARSLLTLWKRADS